MSGLHIDIVTPERLVLSGEALEVRVPGWEGQFGVLPEHDMFLALLRAGVCTVIDSENRETRYLVGRGFAEAGPDKVTVLTDSCQPAGDIDKDQAKKDLAEAEAEMADLDPLSEAFRGVQARAEHARARLDA